MGIQAQKNQQRDRRQATPFPLFQRYRAIRVVVYLQHHVLQYLEICRAVTSRSISHLFAVHTYEELGLYVSLSQIPDISFLSEEIDVSLQNVFFWGKASPINLAKSGSEKGKTYTAFGQDRNGVIEPGAHG